MPHSQGPFIVQIPTGGNGFEEGFVIGEVAAGGTLVNGTGFVSRELPVHDVDTIVVQVRAAGALEGMEGLLTCKFVGTVDGNTWGTVPYAEISVNMDGVNAVVVTQGLDVSGLRAIRLQSIVNEDATEGHVVEGVEVKWGKSYAY